ncbi:putative glutathione-dependent formaldehyde-activating enzyme [Lyophyllum shimeji]|uniref:Glutathione-dependent formaldehyde-activating enzyme n=1 Tax=Lyophyllum shimeji TaxID=47721 RepID=A0A9P3PIE4_LYOSH|nr:putative glutathione-dependent formaldehyde-activating enzyme [Lyophyllum shimeji]
MANAIFKADQVMQTQGHKHIRTFRDTKTGSGEVLIRSFCGMCGANVFLGHDEGDYRIVATGTLDEEPGWVPRHEKYPGGKRPWIEGIKTQPSKL